MKLKPNEKRLKLGIKIASTTISIIVLFLIIYTLFNSQALQQEFSSQIQTYGIPALFIFSLLLDLTPQIISPAVLLAASLLAGINTQYAIITTILGSATGSILGFALGKKYMYSAVQLTASKKATAKITQLTNKYGKIIIPIAAISPLPYLPILIGAMNFSKRNFIIFGLIPRALSFIILGYLIQSI